MHYTLSLPLFITHVEFQDCVFSLTPTSIIQQLWQTLACVRSLQSLAIISAFGPFLRAHENNGANFIGLMTQLSTLVLDDVSKLTDFTSEHVRDMITPLVVAGSLQHLELRGFRLAPRTLASLRTTYGCISPFNTRTIHTAQSFFHGEILPHYTKRKRWQTSSSSSWYW